MKKRIGKQILFTIFYIISSTLYGQNSQLEMTLKELKNEIEFENLGPGAQFAINEFIYYYDSVYENTRLILGKVKSRYNSKNIHEFYGDGTEVIGEVHLEFVTGYGLDFATIICLNNGGNVEDDRFFGKIVDDGWSEKINWNELIQDEDWKLFCEIAERLYYTWLAYIWQQINGYETGLDVSIIDGSASQKFSLNDYSWDEFSKFVDIDESENRVKSQFNKPLTLQEIYLRTGKTNR